MKPKPITILRSIAVALAITACSTQEDISKTTPPVALKALATGFAKGADISWLPQMEANGYTFKNSAGTTQDCITILKNLGINSVRLRTWVNPSSDPTSGHCSDAETADLAKRCKAAGLRVMIDLHFGDTWNSVGVQNPPAAWASMTYSQMLTAMHNYVFHTMNVIKTRNVTPEWVQIGNEINSGICHPIGSVSKPAQMTGLLMAAYTEVKAVFPSAKVIIHVAQPQGTTAQPLLDAYLANGGQWDITGCSSYASLANQPAVQGAVQNLRTRFNKPVMMVEVGGPVTKAAQTASTITLWLNGINDMSGSSGGVFYWEPEGYSPFVSYTMGAWDSATKMPTAALNAFN